MKIEALRGENLASLRRFDLALNEPPLSEAGLFAITGPTGAGKSTLLDAICLALYDKVPRLQRAKAKDGGEPGLSAGDARGLLRKGTEQAWVEVDFKGRDGRPYRARWEAWRARRKLQGKLQEQKLSLISLLDQVDLSGTKTQTLAALQARIGLSFDEFQRAVLLPQGEFAAFLDSSPQDRASLLERMTGTELYSALSKAAHLRAKAAVEALEQQSAALQALPRVSPGQRAQLQAELSSALERQARAEAQAELLKAGLRWHELRAERAREAAAAQAAELEAERAFQAAEPLRQALQEAERAAPLAPKLDWAQRSEAQAKQAEAEAAEAAEALREAQAAREAALSRRAEAIARAEALKAAQAARAEERARAAQLDEQLAAAEARLGEAAAEDKARAEAHAELQARLSTLRTEIESLEAERRKHAAQIEARAGLKALAEDPSWRDQLRSLGALAATERAAEEALSAQEELRAEAAARHAQAKLALSQAEAEREAAQSSLTAAEETLAAEEARAAPEALEQAIEQAVAQRAELRQAQALPEEARGQARAADKAARDGARQAQAAARAGRRRDAASAEAEAARAELKTLSSKLLSRELRAQLGEQRAELLSPEAPCPLCGASPACRPAQPPVEPQSKAARARLERLRQRRAQLEQAREEAQRAALEAQAAHSAAETRRRAAKAEEKTAGERVKELQTTWKTLLRKTWELWTRSPVLAEEQAYQVALPLPEQATAEDAAAGLDAAAAAISEISTRIRGRQQALRVARAAREAALSVAQEAARAQRAAQSSLQEAAQSAAARQEELAAGRAALALAALKREEREAQLRGPLAQISDWPERLRSGAEPLIEGLEGELDALEGEQAALTACASAQRAAQDELQRAAGGAEEREAARAQAALTLQQAKAALDSLRGARAPLLDGLSVRAFDAAQAQAEAEAAAALQTAQAAVEAALDRSASAAEREKGASARSAQARQAAEEAEEALLQATRAAGWEHRAALERALDHTEQWLAEARVTRASADRARTEAQAHSQDRLRRLRAHEASADRPLPPPPGLRPAPGFAYALTHMAAEDEAERAALPTEAPTETRSEAALEAALRLTLARRQAAQEDALRWTAARSQAAEAERRAAQLGPQLKAARAEAEAWAELSDVIGSADGKKLRTFAQGLSLGILVEEANRHLAQLRPRYQLERVPGADMELRVIDRDLGETARPLSSLSGGERFLVALSLSLALSSLSAQDVQIESLFIDEGFGALDPETLELALSTMDQLQAEGRQVGLISHVPELAERVGYRVELRRIGPGESALFIPDPT